MEIRGSLIYGGGAARRRGEMADFDSSGTNEGEMFGPEFGQDLIHEACHLIQALAFHGSGGCETETDAVENDGDLCCERFECADLTARCGEEIVRDHLQKVDAIEVIENASGKFGTPSESNSVWETVHLFSLRIRHSRRHNRPHLHNLRHRCNCCLRCRSCWTCHRKSCRSPNRLSLVR